MTRRLFLGPVALIIGSLLNASVCAAQDIKTIYEDLDLLSGYNIAPTPQDPPLPLPPPPPPPPPTKNKNRKVGRSKSQESSTFEPLPETAGPSKSELKESVNEFEKALALASDCETKNRILTSIIMAYYNLGAEAEVDESMLKIAESECATDEIKSSMYYSIGVNNWKRAYDLSIKYASRNINIQARAPFHYRSITNLADKRKFDDCLTKGFEYIDKALAVNPEYVEAMFYKALFCREKQKTSADAAERKRWADEAIAMVDKATKIQNQKRKEANK
jgi:hypothetical protein